MVYSMIYTVTLNPAIDYVVCLGAALKQGEINRNQTEDFQFGGKGINVSNVLRTLGMVTTALGFVAGFTGDALEQGLQNMGLQTDFVHAASGMTRINVKIKANEETEINGIGPQISMEELETFYRKLEDVREGDVLVISGSIPSCLPDDTYEQIMRRLEGRGVRIAVDASGELLMHTLKYRPFLIKPNHHELGDLFGKTLSDDEEIEACARRLQAMGARNVLVSMAGDGALLLDETGAVHRIGCPRGKVVNSVGAGDSMVAGFLAGYMRTDNFAQALRLAVAAGSATTFSLGLCSGMQVQTLMERDDW